eukprot:jgi/Mesvir1/2823/Mv13919-RA.3
MATLRDLVAGPFATVSATAAFLARGERGHEEILQKKIGGRDEHQAGAVPLLVQHGNGMPSSAANGVAQPTGQHHHVLLVANGAGNVNNGVIIFGSTEHAPDQGAPLVVFEQHATGKKTSPQPVATQVDRPACLVSSTGHHQDARPPAGSVASLVKDTAGIASATTALRGLTRGSLLALADGVASLLRRAGLTAGDAVLLPLPNVVEFVPLFLGVTFARMVAVPLNPSFTVSELDYFIAESAARVAVVADGVAGDSILQACRQRGVSVWSVALESPWPMEPQGSGDVTQGGDATSTAGAGLSPWLRVQSVLGMVAVPMATGGSLYNEVASFGRHVKGPGASGASRDVDGQGNWPGRAAAEVDNDPSSESLTTVSGQSCNMLANGAASAHGGAATERVLNATEGFMGPDPDDIAILLHTSGTTGRPKGVPLRHRNLVHSALSVAAHFRLTAADVTVAIMPLFHIQGLVVSLLAPLAVGCRTAMLPVMDPRAFFRIGKAVGITWYTAGPTLHAMLLAEATRHPALLWPPGRLRFLRSSSAPLPPALLARLEATFCAPLCEAYAMTEASGTVACNPLPPLERVAGTVGVATSGVDLAVFDNDACTRVAPGVVGEVCVRGPGVMSGYLARPGEAIADPFFVAKGVGEGTGDEEGGTARPWFRTGDQGYLGEDGYLRLVGRKSDIINRGGEKILPDEVENVLQEHPRVTRAVVFGRPHELYGQQVAALISLKDDVTDVTNDSMAAQDSLGADATALAHDATLVGDERTSTPATRPSSHSPQTPPSCSLPLSAVSSTTSSSSSAAPSSATPAAATAGGAPSFHRPINSAAAPTQSAPLPSSAELTVQGPHFLSQWCSARLAPHKLPALYYLLASAEPVPVSSTGKVQRRKVAVFVEENPQLRWEATNRGTAASTNTRVVLSTSMTADTASVAGQDGVGGKDGGDEISDASNSLCEVGALNETERQVADVWRDALGLDPSLPVSRDDNFLSLGGHSMSGVAVVGSLNAAFALEPPHALSVVDLLQQKTMGEIAEIILAAVTAMQQQQEQQQQQQQQQEEEEEEEAAAVSASAASSSNAGLLHPTRGGGQSTKAAVLLPSGEQDNDNSMNTTGQTGGLSASSHEAGNSAGVNAGLAGSGPVSVTPKPAGASVNGTGMTTVTSARPSGPVPLVRSELSYPPLSYAQEQMLLVHDMDPRSAAYNVAWVYVITGPLRLDVLKASLDVVVARHEPFRTHFGIRDGTMGPGSAALTGILASASPVTSHSEAGLNSQPAGASFTSVPAGSRPGSSGQGGGGLAPQAGIGVREPQEGPMMRDVQPGEPYQIIVEADKFVLPFELRGLLPGQDLPSAMFEMAQRPFDLYKGPVVRMAVLRMPDVTVQADHAGSSRNNDGDSNGESSNNSAAITFDDVAGKYGVNNTAGGTKERSNDRGTAQGSGYDNANKSGGARQLPQHALVVVTHNCSCDGYSRGVFIGELSLFYNRLAQGQAAADLPDPTIRYRDYSAWQRAWLGRGEMDRQLEYWKRHLADAPPLLEFPTDFPRPQLQTFRGHTLGFEVPGPLVKRLRAVAAACETTLYSVLLSCWALLLGRYSRQDKVVVAALWNGRPRAALQWLVGCFLNPLPLCLALPPVTSSFRQVARSTHQTLLGGISHADIPFHKVVEALGLSGDGSCNPVFQTMVVLNEFGDGGESLDDFSHSFNFLSFHKVAFRANRMGDASLARLPSNRYHRVSTRFDLYLALNQGDKGSLSAHMAYRVDLWGGDTMARVAQQFQGLLASVAECPVDGELRTLMRVARGVRAHGEGGAGGKAAGIRHEKDMSKGDGPLGSPNRRAQESSAIAAPRGDTGSKAISAAGPTAGKKPAHTLADGSVADATVARDSAMADLAAPAESLGEPPAVLESKTIEGHVRVHRATARDGMALARSIEEGPTANIPGAGSGAAAVASEEEKGHPSCHLKTHVTAPAASDAAVCLFTSGSTGTPKGVVYTQASLVAKMASYWAAFPYAPAASLANPADVAVEGNAAAVTSASRDTSVNSNLKGLPARATSGTGVAASLVDKAGPTSTDGPTLLPLDKRVLPSTDGLVLPGPAASYLDMVASTRSDELVLAKTTVTFLDHVLEIWGSLLHGVPALMASSAEARDPTALLDLLSASGATRLIVVPSLLAALLDVGQPCAEWLAGGCIRFLFTSGEPLSPSLAARFLTTLEVARGQQIKEQRGGHGNGKQGGLPGLGLTTLGGATNGTNVAVPLPAPSASPPPAHLAASELGVPSDGRPPTHDGPRLINLYGTTETCGDASFVVVTDAMAAAPRVPIGWPMPGAVLRVVDAYDQSVTPGMQGELCVAGPWLATGYLKEPEKSRERFVTLPPDDEDEDEGEGEDAIGKGVVEGVRDGQDEGEGEGQASRESADGSHGEEGEKKGSKGTARHKASRLFYRTGDRARLLPNGQVELLGRFDLQLKVRGHRLEPEFVETTLLRAVEGAQACGVVLLTVSTGSGKVPAASTTSGQGGQESAPTGNNTYGDEHRGHGGSDGSSRDKGGVTAAAAAAEQASFLVAVVSRAPGPQGARLTPEGVLATLRRHLPLHAVPAWVLLVDQLPRTPSGKVDRGGMLRLASAELSARMAGGVSPPPGETLGRGLREVVAGSRGDAHLHSRDNGSVHTDKSQVAYVGSGRVYTAASNGGDGTRQGASSAGGQDLGGNPGSSPEDTSGADSAHQPPGDVIQAELVAALLETFPIAAAIMGSGGSPAPALTGRSGTLPTGPSLKASTTGAMYAGSIGGGASHQQSAGAAAAVAPPSWSAAIRVDTDLHAFGLNSLSALRFVRRARQRLAYIPGCDAALRINLVLANPSVDKLAAALLAADRQALLGQAATRGPGAFPGATHPQAIASKATLPPLDAEAVRSLLQLSADDTLGGSCGQGDAASLGAAPMPSSSSSSSSSPSAPLSHEQEHAVRVYEADGGDAPRWHVCYQVRIVGPLREELLRRCMAALVARHDALRTRFVYVGGAARQVVADAGTVTLPLSVVDVTAGDGASTAPSLGEQGRLASVDDSRAMVAVNSGTPDQQPGGGDAADLARMIAEHAAAPFDLATAPLARALLLRGPDPRQHVISLVLHCSVGDALSLRIWAHELAEAYRQLAAGEASIHLPSLPLQYRHLSTWRRRWLEDGGEMGRQLAYWREQLSDATSLMALPTDLPRGHTQELVTCASSTSVMPKVGTVPLDIGGSAAEGLRRVGRECGAGLPVVLLAVWAAVLARYSGQSKVPVLLGVHGRVLAQEHGVVGPFANALPVVVPVARGRSLREVIGAARGAVQGATEHGAVPYHRVLQMVRGKSGSLLHGPCHQGSIAGSDKEDSMAAINDRLDEQRDNSDISKSQAAAAAAARMGAPVFQAMLMVDELPRDIIALAPGCDLRPMDDGGHLGPPWEAELCLRLSRAVGSEASLSGHLAYRADLWERASMEALAEQLAYVAASLSAEVGLQAAQHTRQAPPPLVPGAGLRADDATRSENGGGDTTVGGHAGTAALGAAKSTVVGVSPWEDEATGSGVPTRPPAVSGPSSIGPCSYHPCPYGPCSYGQEALLAIHEMDPASAAYNMPLRWQFVGELRIPTLRAALEAVVARHGALRTHYLRAGASPLVALARVPTTTTSVAATGKLSQGASVQPNHPFPSNIAILGGSKGAPVGGAHDVGVSSDTCTWMTAGVATQAVIDAASFVLPFAQLDVSGAPDPAGEATRRLQDAARQPFDPYAGPLFRATLVRVTPQRHILLLNLHHSVADGLSVTIIQRELRAWYAQLASAPEQGALGVARRGSAPPSLPPLPVTYIDYAAWQRRWLEDGGEMGRQLAYWREQLADATSLLALPTDRPRPPLPSFRGARVSFDLGDGVLEATRLLGRECGATSFMVLLAGWALLFHRYSGQHKVVLGTPWHGRTVPETQPLVGYFVNPIPVCVDVDVAGGTHATTFLDIVKRARDALLGAMDNADAPFHKLVAALGLPFDPSHNPVFQVLVGWNEPGETAAAPGPGQAWGKGLTCTRLGAKGGGAASAKMDLEISMSSTPGGGVAGTIVYAMDLFDADSITTMAARFADLVRACVARGEVPLADVELMAEEDWRRLRKWTHGGACDISGVLRSVRGTTPTEAAATNCTASTTTTSAAAATPAEAAEAAGMDEGDATDGTSDAIKAAAPPPSLLGLWDRQVAARPHACAARTFGEGSSVTFAQLDATSKKLSCALAARGVGPGSYAVISLERSLGTVAAILGVLRAGGAYVPLDPRLPEAYLSTILATVRPAAVITQEDVREKLARCWHGQGQAHEDRPSHLLVVDGEGRGAWGSRDGQGEGKGEIEGEGSAAERAGVHFTGSDGGDNYSREAGGGKALEIEARGMPPNPAPHPDSPALCIFTSGSTGQPKGVVLSHRSVLAKLAAYWSLYPFGVPASGRSMVAATLSVAAGGPTPAPGTALGIQSGKGHGKVATKSGKEKVEEMAPQAGTGEEGETATGVVGGEGEIGEMGTAGEMVLARTTPSFIDHVLEVLGSLLAGAPLLLASEEQGRDPRALLAMMVACRVTRLVVVPSLLAALVEEDERTGRHWLGGGVAVGRGEVEGGEPLPAPSLRLCIVSGEPLPLATARKFLAALPSTFSSGGPTRSSSSSSPAISSSSGIRLVNLYGCSETCGDATLGEVTLADGRVTVGRPIPGMSAFILADGGQRLVAPGMVGELYVGGDLLAEGYLHEPGLTSAAFIPTTSLRWATDWYKTSPEPRGMGTGRVTASPAKAQGGQAGLRAATTEALGVGSRASLVGAEAQAAAPPGLPSRLYKTGDLARWLPATGEMELLGRVDAQVQVRGHRVELGAVEDALMLVKGVTAAIVIALDDHGGPILLSPSFTAQLPSATTAGVNASITALVAVVCPAGLDHAMTLGSLRARLPEYAVPSRVLAFDTFPRLPNGKLDRRRLVQLVAEALTPTALGPARTGRGLAMVAGSEAIEAAASVNGDEGDGVDHSTTGVRREVETAGSDEGNKVLVREGGTSSLALNPRSALERRLAAIWRSTLGLRHVSLLDDFFAIGGHSLAALRLRGEMERVDPELAALLGAQALAFRHRTIADMARAAEEAMARQGQRQGQGQGQGQGLVLGGNSWQEGASTGQSEEGAGINLLGKEEGLAFPLTTSKSSRAARHGGEVEGDDMALLGDTSIIHRGEARLFHAACSNLQLLWSLSVVAMHFGRCGGQNLRCFQVPRMRALWASTARGDTSVLHYVPRMVGGWYAVQGLNALSGMGLARSPHGATPRQILLLILLSLFMQYGISNQFDALVTNPGERFSTTAHLWGLWALAFNHLLVWAFAGSGPGHRERATHRRWPLLASAAFIQFLFPMILSMLVPPDQALAVPGMWFGPWGIHQLGWQPLGPRVLCTCFFFLAGYLFEQEAAAILIWARRRTWLRVAAAAVFAQTAYMSAFQRRHMGHVVDLWESSGVAAGGASTLSELMAPNWFAGSWYWDWPCRVVSHVSDSVLALAMMLPPLVASPAHEGLLHYLGHTPLPSYLLHPMVLRLAEPASLWVLALLAPSLSASVAAVLLLPLLYHVSILLALRTLQRSRWELSLGSVLALLSALLLGLRVLSALVGSMLHGLADE